MNQYERYRPFKRMGMFPPVIKWLLIINITVFIVEKLILNIYTIGDVSLREYFISYFYLWPLEGNFSAHFLPWQLITYQFIHFDIWHIFFNMFALWMFGIELEHNWGSTKFLVFYLLSGIGAAITQLIIPFIIPGYPGAPTIGASGAVYGVLLAFGFSYPDRPIFMFPFFIPIPAKFFVLLYTGLALIMGISGSADSNIAHFAHLGGALTGFILFKFGDRWRIYSFFEKIVNKKPSQRVYSTKKPKFTNIYEIKSQQQKSYDFYDEPAQKTTPHFIDGEEITQARIDEILDKISNYGWQNLTEKEKQILFELSQKLK